MWSEYGVTMDMFSKKSQKAPIDRELCPQVHVCDTLDKHQFAQHEAYLKRFLKKKILIFGSSSLLFGKILVARL